MAVARITADKRWHRKAARLMGVTTKAGRELERAAERLGRTAELYADEMRELARVMPNDQHVIDALEALRVAEESDRRRRERVQKLIREHHQRNRRR